MPMQPLPMPATPCKLCRSTTLSLGPAHLCFLPRLLPFLACFALQLRMPLLYLLTLHSTRLICMLLLPLLLLLLQLLLLLLTPPLHPRLRLRLLRLHQFLCLRQQRWPHAHRKLILASARKPRAHLRQQEARLLRPLPGQTAQAGYPAGVTHVTPCVCDTCDTLRVCDTCDTLRVTHVTPCVCDTRDTLRMCMCMCPTFFHALCSPQPHLPLQRTRNLPCPASCSPILRTPIPHPKRACARDTTQTLAGCFGVRRCTRSLPMACAWGITPANHMQAQPCPPRTSEGGNMHGSLSGLTERHLPELTQTAIMASPSATSLSLPRQPSWPHRAPPP